MYEDLKRLKVLWDYSDMIYCTYEDWYKTLWSAIDTAKLQDQNRNLFNQIKNITYKEIKNYKT